MKNFNKYLAEGLLIVFSVLFALYINKSVATYETNKQKKIALESIRNELKSNAGIVAQWKTQHIKIRNRITDISEGKNDTLKSELLKYKYLNLGILTNNESLVNTVLSSTAWESAKSTGILTEFDFATIQKLTKVYSVQQMISDKTLEKILEYYFTSEAHDMQNLDRILVQFQLRFWELTGQEEILGSLYEEALAELP